MKNVILGTAGHVDHGKTALIYALTGIDTDRLAEEKKRGITIELGFAHLDFDDGFQIGIVDVPGHEKFIKNMLAGAGGIDMGMLVIAANEGVMPQTIEHLDILRILGVRDGLVVITKTDMVDDEWIELVRSEAESLVKGTFLEGKPILSVSARTGEGITELKENLKRLVTEAEEKNLRIPFRLPVDRVFPVDGFGTVVTGTLIEGIIQVGDAVELMPAGRAARVRNLQVHGKSVSAAGSGQRVAINLAGVRCEEVNRGDVIVRTGSIRRSRMLDVRLDVLSNSRRSIKNESVLHLYHGARVMLAKAVLFGRDELQAGESCFAQLRLTETLAAKAGDRFVLRFLSPVETIGGGVVLDAQPKKHKRSDSTIISALQVRESGSLEKRIIQAVSEQNISMPDIAHLSSVLHIEGEEIDEAVSSLVSRGLLVEALEGRYAVPEVLDSYWRRCQTLLAEYHTANPLYAGMPLPMLRQKLFQKRGQVECDAVLRSFAAEERLRIVSDRAALFDFQVQLTKRQKAVRERLLSVYKNAGINVQDVDKVIGGFDQKERSDAAKVLESLVTGGEMVLLTPKIYIHKTVFDSVWQQIEAHFAENEFITLAELRDKLGTTRKYAQVFLEYCDRSRITRYDEHMQARRLIAKK